MGYAHYFEYLKPDTILPLDLWRLFLEKIKFIIKLAKELDEIDISLDYEHVKLTDDKILINAGSGHGRETLAIYRDPRKTYKVHSCKTGHAKYDCVVLAVLYQLDMTFPQYFQLSSDGDLYEEDAEGSNYTISPFEDKYERYKVPSIETLRNNQMGTGRESEELERIKKLLTLDITDKTVISELIHSWGRLGCLSFTKKSFLILVASKQKYYFNTQIYSKTSDPIQAQHDFRSAIKKCLSIQEDVDLHSLIDLELDAYHWHNENYSVSLKEIDIL